MNRYSARMQLVNQALAVVVMLFSVVMLKINVGLAPTIIVGASAGIGFLCWRLTNLKYPIDPVKTASLLLLTVAGLHVHMYEEHMQLFGPAMSRLFGIAFPDDRFLLIFVFILPTIYFLTTIGLLKQVPLAGFVAWFIFIGLGIAEFTHFLFPLIQPALEPAKPIHHCGDGQWDVDVLDAKSLHWRNRPILLSWPLYCRYSDDSWHLFGRVAAATKERLSLMFLGQAELLNVDHLASGSESHDHRSGEGATLARS